MVNPGHWLQKIIANQRLTIGICLSATRAMSQSHFTPANPLRLAMWSGPRNLSTALMRSWGNRDDTFVCDEPFYAHYLVKTKRAHPMAAEVIAHQENDW